MRTGANRPGCIRRPTGRAAGARAFTLVELLVTIGIISLMLGVVTLTFRRLSDSGALTTAADTLTAAAAVARAYAVEHAIETMLVVNPHNGRLEIWHLNPPPGGGPWDPLSGGDGTVASPVNVNGCVFAPVLDSTAALPRSGDGRTLVVVHPMDHSAVFVGSNPNNDATRVRPYASDPASIRQNWDNLNWVAIAFDPDGRLVQRLRRIATRMPADDPAAPYAVPGGVSTNRRPDGTPDTGRLPPTVTEADKYVVDQNDARITTTRGFIVSDRARFEGVFGTATPAPFELVTQWLDETPGSGLGRRHREYKRQVLLNPWSGRQLARTE